MKLKKEYGLAIAGLVVSFVTLVAGIFAIPTRAAGCKSSACTYYVDGNGYAGNCGYYQGTNCGCVNDQHGQIQAACGAPPAP